MKLFRRSSSIVDLEPPSSQQATASSTIQPGRKSSLTVLPSRIRRRKKTLYTGNPEDDVLAAAQLGHLFLSLPPEILTQIICYLSLSDIYSLRRTSRSTLSILNDNASTIARHFVPTSLADSDLVVYVTSLYPVLSPSPDLRHLLCMLHRGQRVLKAISHTVSYIQMKSWHYATPQTGALIRTVWARSVLEKFLQPSCWTAYHFLEQYRNIIIHQHNEQHNGGSGRFWGCQMCESKARELVASYDKELVRPTFHYLQVLLFHFQAATRPPSMSSPLHRMSKVKSSIGEEDISIFTFFGGLEELSQISMMQGSYTKRVYDVNRFVQQIRTAVDNNQASNAGSKSRIPTWPHKTEAIGLQTDSNSCIQASVDITTLLTPPYTELMQEHIDRLPTLQDFVLPIWQERAERENMYGGGQDDVYAPFRWVEKILLEETALESQATSQAGTGIPNDDDNENQAHPPNAHPGAVHNSPLNLFTAHTPSNLIPVFGASPV